jgi:hypothetical protein
MAKRKPKAKVDIAARLDQYVAQAIADYKEGKGRKARRISLAHGVTRHAHRWCADFLGRRRELVRAGVALPEWFKDDRVCKEVKIGGRMVEIYRGGDSGFGDVEISAKYTPDECKRIWGGDDDDDDRGPVVPLPSPSGLHA